MGSGSSKNGQEWEHLDQIPEKKEKKKKKDQPEVPKKSFSFSADDRNVLLESWNRQIQKELLRTAFVNASKRKDIKAAYDRCAVAMKMSFDNFIERHGTHFVDFWNTAVRNAYYRQDDKAFEMAGKTGTRHSKLAYVDFDAKFFDLLEKAVITEICSEMVDKQKKTDTEKIWRELFKSLTGEMREQYAKDTA